MTLDLACHKQTSMVLSLLSPRLSCPVLCPVSLTHATCLLMPVFCMCPDRWSSMKSAGAPSTDIAGLYSALLKAGIVAATGTPVGAGATVTSEDTAAAPSTSSENLSRWSSKNTHHLSQNWVHEGHVDVKGKGCADGPWSTNNKATLMVDAIQHDAELHTQFIVVPPGDKATTNHWQLRNYRRIWLQCSSSVCSRAWALASSPMNRGLPHWGQGSSPRVRQHSNSAGALCQGFLAKE